MTSGPVAVIRPEAAADSDAVRRLLADAFGGPTEAALLDRLRADGDLVLALVATDGNGSIVGHVAFPRLRVEGAGCGFPALGLAPLAVAETHRRQGIGAMLVLAGLKQLEAKGETLVFVLGDPAYYSRFGFSVEAAQPYSCAYAGPYFMALRLADDAPHSGNLRYPSPFDGLG